MLLVFKHTQNTWLGLSKDHVSAEKYLLLSPRRHCDKVSLKTSSGVTLPFETKSGTVVTGLPVTPPNIPSTY